MMSFVRLTIVLSLVGFSLSYPLGPQRPIYIKPSEYIDARYIHLRAPFANLQVDQTSTTKKPLSPETKLMFAKASLESVRINSFLMAQSKRRLSALLSALTSEIGQLQTVMDDTAEKVEADLVAQVSALEATANVTESTRKNPSTGNTATVDFEKVDKSRSRLGELYGGAVKEVNLVHAVVDQSVEQARSGQVPRFLMDSN